MKSQNTGTCYEVHPHKVAYFKLRCHSILEKSSKIVPNYTSYNEIKENGRQDRTASPKAYTMRTENLNF